MKYFIYCRKSQEAEDRQVLSLEGQALEVKRIIQSDPTIEIIDTFHEAYSAKKPGRPIFNEMIARIENGEAEGIIAWHPDRLARNSMDGGNVIYLLDQQKILDLKFANYSFENSSNGKFMLSIAFGQSKYYSDNLSENVKRGQNLKIENGIWPTRTPDGYRFCDKTKKIIPDADHFKMYRRIFDWFLYENVSVTEIHRRLKDDWGYVTPERKSFGGKPVSKSKIYHILKNPVYAGYILWNGTLYPGNHKPVISKAEFQNVKIRLGLVPKTRKAAHSFVFKDIFVCGVCGKHITTERKQKPSGREYVYYHCTRVHTSPKCIQPSVEERHLITELESYFKAFYIPEPIIEYILKYGAKSEVGQQELLEEQKDRALKLIQDTERRLATLTDLRVRNAISDGDFDERRQKLLVEKDSATEKFDNLNIENGMFEPTALMLILCNRAVYWFRSADNKRKRKLVEILCSNPVLIDKKPIADTIFPARSIVNLFNTLALRGESSGVITCPQSSKHINPTEKQMEEVYKIGNSIPRETVRQMRSLVKECDPAVLADLKDQNLIVG